MAVRHPIPAFPADIDRIAFGHWLSGFTDGEGCFLLACKVRRRELQPRAEFKINLRSDDGQILSLIRSYFSCGSLSNVITDAKPQIRYSVYASNELHDIVVPHFLQFPLRAKKSRDFLIWKTGADFLYQMTLRENRPCQRKWNERDKQEFVRLCQLLRDTREFTEGPIGLIPEFKTTHKQLTIF